MFSWKNIKLRGLSFENKTFTFRMANAFPEMDMNMEEAILASPRERLDLQDLEREIREAKYRRRERRSQREESLLPLELPEPEIPPEQEQ